MKLISFCLFIISPGLSVAATLSPADHDAIEQQQRDILQQNRLQRQEIERSQIPLLSQITKPQLPSGRCFTISTIVLNGAEHLPSAAEQKLTQPYLAQCLGMAQINTLVQQISDWYIAQGYITSRAFLTEQDLSQGTLRLLVMEGKLEDITLDNQQASLLAMTFSGLKDKILNLRDIEQGMEQINRLRNTPVQIEIKPGRQVGYSIVNLTAKPESPVNVTLGFDNSGQKSTGTGQLNGSLTANNLLGLADQWTFNGARSSDFATGHDAQSVQTGVSIPYGYWNIDYTYSYSNYLSTLISQGYPWLSSGDSQSHRVTVSRVLLRNGVMKTAALLGVTHRLNRNYLNDVALQSSAYSLTSLTAGINHSQKLWGGFATLNPAFTHGVPWLGGENDENKAADAPRAEFSKWTLSSSYALPLTENSSWLSSFYSQWSSDRLYGAERLNMGGESSVRGFKEQYLAGDSGGYWRNEIDIELGSLPVLGQISALAAVDGGYLRHSNEDTHAAGTLWGSAIGLGSSNGRFSSQFTLGCPLRYPSSLTPDHASVYYRININL